jgi:small subunit ribosomal protein S16
MSVKIRLARVGTKNAPVYRVVATDVRNKRDGQPLEILGTYNPGSGTFVQFHVDKMLAWVNKGAQMTDTVKKLHKQYQKQQKTIS